MVEKYACVTGASRGIGAQAAIDLAKAGYHVALLAKTMTAHPKLPGSLEETAKEVEKHGVKALPIAVDLRNHEDIEKAFYTIGQQFPRLDVLLNNASAISLTSTEATPAKKYDLMQSVNGRATFLCSQSAFSLMKDHGGHIVMMSPPLSLKPRWFAPHLAYTMSKYQMSFCVLGLSAEWKNYNIAVNALWPKTIIATSAIEFNFPPHLMKQARDKQIVSDAFMALIKKDPQSVTGQFFLDQELLEQEGMSDFNTYAIEPGQELFLDLYVE
jgi:citronellol/citronellal dehydrogenase